MVKGVKERTEKEASDRSEGSGGYGGENKAEV